MKQIIYYVMFYKVCFDSTSLTEYVVEHYIGANKIFI